MLNENIKLKEILYERLDMLFDKLEALNKKLNENESELQEDLISGKKIKKR